MFSDRVARAVAAGEVSETYRRSPAPPATGVVRTVAGLIEVTEVCRVEPESLTDADARRAGFTGAEGMRASLARHGAGSVYRLRLSFRGPAELPAPDAVVLEARQRRALDVSLARLDAEGARGPWTRWLLRRIAAGGGVRPAELAVELSRPVSRCKTDVWRLRELGLVEPGAEGVRLSGLGVAYLAGLVE